MANPNPPTDHLKETQWKEGQSGNPAGKPPGKHRSTILRELMDLVISGEDMHGLIKEMPVEAALMHSLIREGLEGDIQAIKEIQDSLYGKNTDKQEIKQDTKIEFSWKGKSDV
ncbi:DUF5681 domain-containing protein [Dyadobacter sp. CY261]|uniref:DUF5681 domain-containing protein n=1 Tax=Dyadobacter sp. CY261 TaxID=2907203 RepID=UPI001F3F122F|nr:DUF5681 domain-containing protein [Dyadobacter sp. CY261]MCF0075450.1 DUF5681 domain-containing protein [Dyadobacter sp. CY261]